MTQRELVFDTVRTRAPVTEGRERSTPARGVDDSEVRSTSLLLTVKQVADHLGCGRTFVYELIGTGELEAVKLGRLRRIPASALDALVQRLRVHTRDS